MIFSVDLLWVDRRR